MFSTLARIWYGGCLSLLLSLMGCSRSADGPCVLLYSDFEQFEGWVNPLPSFLNTERAYSGKYSYRLAEGTEFGSGYSTTLGACGFMPRKLKLSARVYLPSGRIRSTLLIVYVLRHGRQPDIWKALSISQVVTRYQVWEPVQKYVHLPSDLQPTDEVKVYVWHVEPGGEPTWFDDIKLEGWP